LNSRQGTAYTRPAAHKPDTGRAPEQGEIVSDSDTPKEDAEVVADWAQLTDVYDEGMSLVEEASAYFSEQGEIDKENLPPMAKTAFISESMRLTTRLTQMMSWLMLQRAVASGEVSFEEARKSEHRLRPQPREADIDDESRSLLPDALTNLVERSEHLYNRVERLETEFQSGNSENVVQSMIDRIESEIKNE
jgi:regulator of CtrA degradation